MIRRLGAILAIAAIAAVAAVPFADPAAARSDDPIDAAVEDFATASGYPESPWS